MTNNRLQLLRNKMRQEGIDVYYFNTSDYHMSEYVSEYFKTIAYFSGFTGSLATLLVDLEKAYIFVDGRYHVQADKQCLINDVEVIKLGTKDALEPLDFIKKFYKGKVLGLDGKRTSAGFGKKLLDLGINFKSIDIYSDIIENRAPLKNDRIYELDDRYTGLARNKKLKMIAYYLKDDVHFIKPGKSHKAVEIHNSFFKEKVVFRCVCADYRSLRKHFGKFFAAFCVLFNDFYRDVHINKLACKIICNH